MTGEVNRVYVLEQRMDDLGQTVNRVDTKLDGIAATLSSLARIEERQMHSNEKTAAVASQTADHETRLRVLERITPDNLEERIVKIESVVPSLQESRSWLIKGILGVLGILGLALLKLVIYTN